LVGGELFEASYLHSEPRRIDDLANARKSDAKFADFLGKV
jgi:hypothetical protein